MSKDWPRQFILTSQKVSDSVPKKCPNGELESLSVRIWVRVLSCRRSGRQVGGQ